MAVYGKWALAVCVLCLLTHGSTAAADYFRQTIQGMGTYYGEQKGAGHCSFQKTGAASLPWTNGIAHFVAIGTSLYDSGLPCGLCVAYRGTGGGDGDSPPPTTYTSAMVCDSCPECGQGLDFATSGGGKYPIEWIGQQCDVGSSPFNYFILDTSTQYYTKFQISNTRVPVVSIRVLQDGAWTTLAKTDDNFFEYKSSGKALQLPCDIELTSLLGDTVKDTIPAGIAPGQSAFGTAQFPLNPHYPSVGATPKPSTQVITTTSPVQAPLPANPTSPPPLPTPPPSPNTPSPSPASSTPPTAARKALINISPTPASSAKPSPSPALPALPALSAEKFVVNAQPPPPAKGAARAPGPSIVIEKFNSMVSSSSAAAAAAADGGSKLSELIQHGGISAAAGAGFSAGGAAAGSGRSAAAAAASAATTLGALPGMFKQQGAGRKLLS